MFRSEDVSMVRVYITSDIAHKVLEDLGAREMIHFIAVSGEKLQKTEKRAKTEKILTRLDFLMNELAKQEIKPVKTDKIPPLISPIEKLSKEVEKHYYRAGQLAQIMKESAAAIERLQEDVAVLQEIEKVVEDGIDPEFVMSRTEGEIGLEYVAGVISKDQILTLERFLWKSLHGNLCFIPIEMTDPKKGGFICFTHGERAIGRIENVCTKVGARVVRTKKKKNPAEERKDPEKREGDLLQVSSDLAQVTRMRQINLEAYHGEMKTIARDILIWKYHVIREIELEAVKEKLEINKENTYLIGHGFILKRDEERFGRTIKKICELHGDVAAEIVPVPEGVVRPTHFDGSRLTKAFQELTNVYGIPAYKEINPTIFSIVTFPFLFGAMFGDVGHGLIVLAFGAYLVRKEKQLEVPKSMEIIFEGRYALILMGIWSVYFGFLYGDFMGVGFGTWLSAYTGRGRTGVCYFGIDHVWHSKEVGNGGGFINSLKMKTSIVIGFVHLTAGLVLNAMNAIFKKDKVRLFGAIVPQILIFFSLIGYMVFLIVLKWVTPRESWPGIVGVVIEMVSFAKVEEEKKVYGLQNVVQPALMCIFLASVPCMFFATPLYYTLKKVQHGGGTAVEMWMHSMIEGVEFLMGLISNISSYLRLWAVSLAHSELTGILFEKTIGDPEQSLFFKISTFPIWVVGTFVLLIGLEGLSSTLHSLRLHWVEFGSKFYAGNGVLFRPFTFRPEVLLDSERQPGQ